MIEDDDADNFCGEEFGGYDVDETQMGYHLPQTQTQELLNEIEHSVLPSQMIDIKKTHVEAIGYSKKAKRVDVKKLKDTMWQQLTRAKVSLKLNHLHLLW